MWQVPQRLGGSVYPLVFSLLRIWYTKYFVHKYFSKQGHFSNGDINKGTQVPLSKTQMDFGQRAFTILNN